jgi:hypothetical protein
VFLLLDPSGEREDLEYENYIGLADLLINTETP